MILSVALCTFNGNEFLEEQINSILAQSKKIDELIICDDCSSDETPKLLKKYRQKHPNLIKVIFNKKPLGTIKNFEKAISLTLGDIIFLSDQDDIWNRDKVEKMLQFINERKNCKLVFTNGALIDDGGKSLNSTLWEKWGFSKEKQILWKNNEYSFQQLLINNNKITGATICFRKSLKEKIFPFLLPMGFWHDGWLGLNASAQNGLFFIEEPLIKYRVHKNQQIGISNDVKEEITSNANRFPVERKEFEEQIKQLYPHKFNRISMKKSHKILRMFSMFRKSSN